LLLSPVMVTQLDVGASTTQGHADFPSICISESASSPIYSSTVPQKIDSGEQE
jgi:hypothetical protein